MVALNSPQLLRMVQTMKAYDRTNTVSILAGLLTSPSLQANSLRIETALHLAVAYCAGSRIPRRHVISVWLNDDTLLGCVKHLEDPATNVFVTNIETSRGNRRIFEGDWISNSYYAQCVIDTITSSRAPRECAVLSSSVFALLRLSEEVAERLNLDRWTSEQSFPSGSVALPSSQEISRRTRAIEFTDDQLDVLGISRRALAPFVIGTVEGEVISRETLGHTRLERHPVLDVGTKLLLALPAAVSPAIRRYIVTELLQSKKLRSFERAIGRTQAIQVERDCLRRLEAPREFVEAPPSTPDVPSAFEWLLRYDENKYVHTILLNDDGLRDISFQGLCFPVSVRAATMKTLKHRISQVARECQRTDGFTVGWTLLVIGGIGRARVLEFSNRSKSWHVCAISVSDFVLLCHDIDRPLRRFLKFLVQKTRITDSGIRFGPSTDYDIYSYWRQKWVPVPAPRDGLRFTGDYFCRRRILCCISKGSSEFDGSACSAGTDWRIPRRIPLYCGSAVRLPERAAYLP